MAFAARRFNAGNARVVVIATGLKDALDAAEQQAPEMEFLRK